MDANRTLHVNSDKGLVISFCNLKVNTKQIIYIFSTEWIFSATNDAAIEKARYNEVNFADRGPS